MCSSIIWLLFCVLVLPTLGHSVQIQVHLPQSKLIQRKAPRTQNLPQAEHSHLPLQQRGRRQYPIYSGSEVQQLAYENKEGGYKSDLSLKLNPEYDNELTASMSQLKLHLFKAMVQGLSKADANSFAQEIVLIQVVFRALGLQLGTPVEVLAQAFQTAITTGTAQGMTRYEATHFAREMLTVESIFGAVIRGKDLSSNLKLLSGGSTINDLGGLTATSGGLLGGIVKGRAHTDDQSEARESHPSHAQGKKELLAPMSPSELQLFIPAFAGARAQGLSKTDATTFAETIVYYQLVLKINWRQLGTTVQAFAQGFASAISTGMAQGMSRDEALQFALAMLRIHTVFGVQSPTTILTFAQQFVPAVLAGTQQGMSKIQAAYFARCIMNIQSFLGIQSAAAVTTFAQSFVKIWSEGVKQGLVVVPSQVILFTFLMLEIEARHGTLPLTTVSLYAQQLASAVAAAIVKGQSVREASVSSITAILAQAGAVGLFFPQPVSVNVKVKVVKEAEGHGPLISKTEVLDNIGQGVLSNLQLLSGGSTINSVSTNLLDGLPSTYGGVLGKLLKGRANTDLSDAGVIHPNHATEYQSESGVDSSAGLPGEEF